METVQHRPERSGESCHGKAVTEGFHGDKVETLVLCGFPVLYNPSVTASPRCRNLLEEQIFPFSGVSASRWGEGLQWRTQLSLQTLLNVPHWGTATALTRSRLSTRSLLDVCHRHTATEPTGETAGANRSQLSLRVQSAESHGFLGALFCTDRTDR